MTGWARSSLAVFAGMVTAVVLVAGMDAISALVYPLPPGLKPTDRAAMDAFMKAVPTGALLLVLLGWSAGAFAGAWVATRLAPGGR